MFELIKKLGRKRKEEREPVSVAEKTDFAKLVQALQSVVERTNHRAPPFDQGKEFEMLSESVDLTSLRRLAELPYEVSVQRYEDKMTFSFGEEFEVELNSGTKLIKALLHNHPQHGGRFVSFTDISDAELRAVISPGIRMFLVTQAGVIEYGPPKRNPAKPEQTGLIDVRDMYLDWERTFSLSQLEGEILLNKIEQLIRESGAIIQEKTWQELEQDPQAARELIQAITGTQT